MRPMRRSLCVLAFSSCYSRQQASPRWVTPLGQLPPRAVIAVLIAMTLEIEDAGQELTDKTEMTVQGIRFTTGKLKDQKGCARHSGMGKVNAAMAATLLVEQFQPTHVLFTGIAEPQSRPPAPAMS